MHTWEIYYPDAAATGLFFARCRIDPTEVLWVHAAPERLAVTVRDQDDRTVGRGATVSRDPGYPVGTSRFGMNLVLAGW